MRNLSKRDMEAYCGDPSQLFYIRKCRLEEGKSKGTDALRIRNGQGLDMLVLPDKCFAIPELTFQGINAGFISKTGICGPQFYQEEGTRGFLRNFEAGFLTTCGLTYMGTPGTEDGQAYGLHGVISNTPAEHVSYGVYWENKEAVIRFGGEVREGYLFGPNMRIIREFEVSTVENQLRIRDRVENLAFERAPLMLLYHFNIGYPMLDESCRLYTNFGEIGSRDGLPEEKKAKSCEFQKPEAGFEEEVYFRTMKEHTKEGFALLHNQELEKAVVLKFDPEQLPVLNEWKSQRAGDYALGLEPGTAHVGGRIRAKEEGILQYLEAGESRTFEIEAEFIDCRTQDEKRKAFINTL